MLLHEVLDQGMMSREPLLSSSCRWLLQYAMESTVLFVAVALFP